MRLLRPWHLATRPQYAAQKRHISDLRPFAEGDLVLLRQKQDRSAPPILTRPLQAGRRIEGHRGVIKHDDIIGSRVRDLVTSSTTKSTKAGTEYRLHNVTLEDYVRLSKRLVTPIYPADARLIVDLLDMYPDHHLPPHHDDHDTTKLEILEAGTGHGSLTLHLSRAIHGFNASIDFPTDDQSDSLSRQWKTKRHAILHTIDVSPKFSAHAQLVVGGFRQGIYARNVDFHVGDVSEKLCELRRARPNAQFVSHAFLDLPAAEGHLAAVASALRVDGTLIVFNPSITQINSCATKIKDQRVPLDLEKVVELGVNGSSGGREWDVRFVRPRSTLKAEMEAGPEAEAENGQGSKSGLQGSDGSIISDLRASVSMADDKWSMVCRPKVGDRITGGGFLGVWKKRRTLVDAATPAEGQESAN
ncbi:tRNA (adenine(58)-N(1))-methyltransferase TrmI [Fulvia fulva]|uniref:tRNA (adenine(58)-N(1))-methyltransferase catalytic subunit TRM61 n=1 Tax=Passalora fulva TaxID=5499 RepID=A0A9Q8L7R4_PASFU|nr:tRNA (adenine(58)-N(1))-methyltransferase TrmI [Fulvia fulva]KAK4636203.1 tRNA (adenine(58)-N(1))-methyltransferase TrmI [Fulvia fulva]KAK4636677.1 tRNA (adenine(58)-N(1))-methyltransferase TrmI [Fulvia fulva]UJO12355.1 tRNA (adenine(58)-N(1))-methyltransferase TrmI [Fulvia fulva]WPV08812.1 tRNA (adenine(58)-N(1))-methyltransferase TrmI [Fulvia fulva]WPV24115.1 tRNA (adenine(58)-N(1))-methyltransferase TrmI [Fulvia fulva]